MAILGCAQTILRIHTILDLGPFVAVILWILYISAHTIRYAYASVRISESGHMKQRKLLYVSGFCDGVSSITYACAVYQIYPIVCIVQTPIVSNAIVAISRGKSTQRFPLQILAFMMCTTGLLVSCSSNDFACTSLLIVIILSDTLSLLLKSKYVSCTDSNLAVNRFNSAVGASSVLTSSMCLGCLTMLRPSLIPAGVNAFDFNFTCIVPFLMWAIILPVMVHLSQRVQQSKFSPLMSFLVCSLGLVLYGPTRPYDFPLVFGQMSLLCGAVILCLSESPDYSGNHSGNALLSRTTE